VSLQFGSNSFYQKLLNETRLRKPAPPLLASLATPQKNTLCSFHFARAGFLFLLMKRVFFCGVLPSKYSGRWRDWPHFDLAREKRNSPQTPLPLFSCSNRTGTEAGGQKFLPPNSSSSLSLRTLQSLNDLKALQSLNGPLPFCPPAWRSLSRRQLCCCAGPPKLLDGRTAGRGNIMSYPSNRSRTFATTSSSFQLDFTI